MACHSLSMAMTLNVMFIFTLVYVVDCRPFAVHAPTPAPAPGPESATTNMEYLKVADDTDDYSLSPQDLSFDLPFPENPFQTPIPDFSLPPIFGFPFPNLPPFDLEEFCEKHYEKLLTIMADKYEQRKKEKLEEVKARLDFGEARKKSTRAQESAYSESRTMSPRRQRRSRSPRHNPSVFTRLRRERSRSPRHEYKSNTRRESTMFKRLGSRGRSTSVHSDSRQESSRYTENHSESEDSEGGHWKSKSRRKKSSVEDDDLSQPWAAAKTERWAMPTWCHMFNSTLTGITLGCGLNDLPPESIDSYNDLREAFLKNYLQQKKCIRDPIVLHNIKQRDGESTEDFIQRYKSESGNVKGAPECMRISGFGERENDTRYPDRGGLGWVNSGGRWRGEKDGAVVHTVLGGVSNWRSFWAGVPERVAGMTEKNKCVSWEAVAHNPGAEAKQRKRPAETSGKEKPQAILMIQS
ncbi:hypothetical protein Tco_1273619 [Tanacetum coccineum]